MFGTSILLHQIKSKTVIMCAYKIYSMCSIVMMISPKILTIKIFVSNLYCTNNSYKDKIEYLKCIVIKY